MQRDRGNLDFDANAVEQREDARLKRQRQHALEILTEARDRLLLQLCDDIHANREVILDSSPDALFSFEFQEIEDRYSARLHAINSLLENLEYRRPKISHRVETFRSSKEDLGRDLNDLVERYDQWDLVDIDVTSIDGGELLVVVSFTVDEYAD